MHHLVTARTVLGHGDATLLVEHRGQAIRLKRRGMPDVYLSVETAAELGRWLLAATGKAAPELARA